jgi:hypothetical protein
MSSVGQDTPATDAPHYKICQNMPGPSRHQVTCGSSRGSWVESQSELLDIYSVSDPEKGNIQTTADFRHSTHFTRSCQRHSQSPILVSINPLILSIVGSYSFLPPKSITTTIHHNGSLCYCTESSTKSKPARVGFWISPSFKINLQTTLKNLQDAKYFILLWYQATSPQLSSDQDNPLVYSHQVNRLN